MSAFPINEISAVDQLLALPVNGMSASAEMNLSDGTVPGNGTSASAEMNFLPDRIREMFTNNPLLTFLINEMSYLNGPSRKRYCHITYRHVSVT